jgi:hypothetical protein
VLECAADMFDRSTLQRMVVNDADADFLVGDDLAESLEIYSAALADSKVMTSASTLFSISRAFL